MLVSKEARLFCWLNLDSKAAESKNCPYQLFGKHKAVGKSAHVSNIKY